jgi:hypothetical protein
MLASEHSILAISESMRSRDATASALRSVIRAVVIIVSGE